MSSYLYCNPVNTQLCLGASHTASVSFQHEDPWGGRSDAPAGVGSSAWGWAAVSCSCLVHLDHALAGDSALLFIYRFIYRLIYLSTYLFIYLFVCLPLSTVPFGCVCELLLSRALGEQGLGVCSVFVGDDVFLQLRHSPAQAQRVLYAMVSVPPHFFLCMFQWVLVLSRAVP